MDKLDVVHLAVSEYWKLVKNARVSKVVFHNKTEKISKEFDVDLNLIRLILQEHAIKSNNKTRIYE